MIRVRVALLNDSTVLTDDQISAYAAAYHRQVLEDLRHHWLVDAVVYFSPRGLAVAPDTWEIHFGDDLDVSGALGYHDLTKADIPVSLIGAKLDLDNGYSPSVTGSHELCEMLVDPYLAQATQVGDSAFVATEICDPCEADRYGYVIHTKSGEPVLVSDFVTPHWFQDGSPGPWDFAGHHTAPLTLLPGGYASVWTPQAGWQQQFARTSDVIDVRGRSSLRSWGRAIRPRGQFLGLR